MKPLLLDFYCKAGGTTKGYQQAGFYVVGVDIEPQPNYCGDEFMQADAIAVLEQLAEWGKFCPELGVSGGGGSYVLGEISGIHASPPCQLRSRTHRINSREHPELIEPTRELLQQTGLPYVIENVKGAPLRDPEILEGQMFGLNTHRPRLFETNWGYKAPFLRPPPPPQAKMGRPPKAGEAIQVVGHFSDVPMGRRALDIDWMNRSELAQAIPPAYTRHVGEQLMSRLQQVAEMTP